MGNKMAIIYKTKIEELAVQAKYFRDLLKELDVLQEENNLKIVKEGDLPKYYEEDLIQVRKWVTNALNNCFMGIAINCGSVTLSELT